MSKTKHAQGINDEIMEKLNLQNRYAFLNANLSSILSDDEMEFLKEVEDFCVKFEKDNKITHAPDEDIYEWIPAFGKEGYITRMYPFSEIDLNYEKYGLTVDLLRGLAIDQFDPQYLMMSGASILAINPIKAHHESIPVRLNALKELVTGKVPGCILITEPERGSDAVHQLTTCEEQEDGSFILNGDKIYNTNAPRSKWAVCYASAEQNEGNKMAQFLIDTDWDGWNCERVFIPWAPKIYLGKEKLDNLKVSKDFVLGGVGKGREHLFEGLVPERIMIASENLCESWTALSFALIYAQMRKQFKQPIMKFQGVGLLLSELWARTNSLTYGLVKFAEAYDEKVEKYGEIPPHIAHALVSTASQFKYMCADLTKDVCYECANVMGGAGLNDNTLMHDLVGISRIQEIVGGSRQIQLYIMSGALASLVKKL